MKRTALITGASSGIGLHLAHEFAAHGHPVILTAPSQTDLQKVAGEITSAHGVQVRVIAKDLEEADAAQEISDEILSAGLTVDILVNNAGQGFHGNWWDIPMQKDLAMIRLNIEAVLRLTKLFLPPMLRRGRGWILNTASMVGFEPSPLLTTYAATKAFVLSWSEALAVELKDSPVTVTALCPGATDTDFFSKADAENIKARQSSNVMAPQDVAKAGYAGLMDGDLFLVPGALNKAMVAARRILPVGTQAEMNLKMNQEAPPEDRKHYRGEKENTAS